MLSPTAFTRHEVCEYHEGSKVMNPPRKTYRQIAAELDTLHALVAELEARNDDLDHFAHMVAHDLKNPLATIAGSLWVMRDLIDHLPDQLQPEGELWLDQIGEAARASEKIIDDLLLLAQARQKTVEPGPVDMAAVVAGALRQLAPLMAESAAVLVLPTVWPKSRGCANWLGAVWTNYLSNAIHYGGTPPRIELGAAVQAEGFVRYWVRDNGAGLREDEIARLFIPFSQLNSRRLQGHGLGLAIVRRIVERLGGETGVESTPGQGSTFFFTLPAAVSD